MSQTQTESAPATWDVPECPFTIAYPPRVLDDIRLAVMDAFFSLPHGGAEIGGILLGRYDNRCLLISDSVPLDCEHAFGPSFKLSPRDLARLKELLDVAHADNLQPAGWYHSHTRSEIFLSDADQEIHRHYFPEPWQVALVLRPHTFQPTRGGFFFRERDGSIRASASYREFALEPLPVHPLPVAPAPSAAHPPLRDRESEPQDPVVTISASVIQEPPPPAALSQAAAPALLRAAQADPAPPAAAGPAAAAASAPAKVGTPPVQPGPLPAVVKPPEQLAAAAPVAVAPAVPRVVERSAPTPAVSPLPIGLPLSRFEFLDTKPDRLRRWLKVTAAIGASVAISAAGYQTRERWLPALMAIVRPAPPPAPPYLGLQTLDNEGQLQIRWDPKSPAVRSGIDGILEITDTSAPQFVQLDAAHLQAGLFSYARQGAKIDIVLIVNQSRGRELREVATFLGKLPDPQPATEDPALRKQRDDLARERDAIARDRDALSQENARLISDLLAQAQRAKKLEKSNKALGAQAARARELDLQVKTLRTQLDQKTQQLKRLGSQNPDQ